MMDAAVKRGTVLLVDDEEGMVRTLRDILLGHDFDVTVARNGAEAVDLAEEYRPDFIVMDIRMPGISGLEAYRRIKHFAPATPVAFMTAYSDSMLIAQALEEGALRVFTKPLDLDELLRTIEQAENAREESE